MADDNKTFQEFLAEQKITNQKLSQLSEDNRLIGLLLREINQPASSEENIAGALPEILSDIRNTRRQISNDKKLREQEIKAGVFQVDDILEIGLSNLNDSILLGFESLITILEEQVSTSNSALLWDKQKEIRRKREELSNAKKQEEGIKEKEKDETDEKSGGIAKAGIAGGALGFGAAAGAGAGVGLAGLGIGGGIAIAALGLAEASNILMDAVERVPPALEEFADAFIEVGEKGEKINQSGFNKFSTALDTLNNAVSVGDAIALAIVGISEKLESSDGLKNLVDVMTYASEQGEGIDEESFTKFTTALESFNDALSFTFITKEILQNLAGIDELKGLADTMVYVSDQGELINQSGFDKFKTSIEKFNESLSTEFIIKEILQNFAGIEEFGELAEQLVNIGQEGLKIDPEGFDKATSALKKLDEAFGLKFAAESILLNFVGENTLSNIAKQLKELQTVDGDQLTQAAEGMSSVAKSIDELGGSAGDKLLSLFTGGAFSNFVSLANAGPNMKIFADSFKRFADTVTTFNDIPDLNNAIELIENFSEKTQKPFKTLSSSMRGFREHHAEILKGIARIAEATITSNDDSVNMSLSSMKTRMNENADLNEERIKNINQVNVVGGNTISSVTSASISQASRATYDDITGNALKTTIT